ncbi:MAG: AAA family ATPase, partial [Acidimicrobiales bacterium]
MAESVDDSRTPALTASWTPPLSPDEVADALRAQGYLAGEGLSTALYLAIVLRRPLFLEGEPGVGKTEVGKAVAGWLGSRLLRLQCYEGIDANQAIYEWDYRRQLLYLRAHDHAMAADAPTDDQLFSERFLVRRPLLQAIAPEATGDLAPPVLLIDEIDR